jgi:hypothetical protein
MWLQKPAKRTPVGEPARPITAPVSDFEHLYTVGDGMQIRPAEAYESNKINRVGHLQFSKMKSATAGSHQWDWGIVKRMEWPCTPDSICQHLPQLGLRRPVFRRNRPRNLPPEPAAAPMSVLRPRPSAASELIISA